MTDQLKYFKKTSNKYQLLFESLEHKANRLFFGALGAALILFILSALTKHLPLFIKHYEGLFNSILEVCANSFLVISAAIHGYIEKMIFVEQSKTYQHMFQLYSIAHDKLTKAIESQNHEEAREIIWELAMESLMENGDWLLLHRSRPMEIPKG